MYCLNKQNTIMISSKLYFDRFRLLLFPVCISLSFFLSLYLSLSLVRDMINKTKTIDVIYLILQTHRISNEIEHLMNTENCCKHRDPTTDIPVTSAS